MSSAEAANEGATVQIPVLLDETKEGKPEFETNVVAAESDDFPDGGLRAWLVLSGVSGPPIQVMYASLKLNYVGDVYHIFDVSYGVTGGFM